MTIKSEEGRAKVTLIVDLGNLLPGAGPQQQPHRGRNGPARMRRRERRAEAQQDARAEEASEKVVESTATKTTDRVEVEKAVETTEKVEDSADIETTERVAFSEHQVKVKVTEEVADEFCSNREYSEHSKVDESDDTTTYEIECWDPGNKWIIQDVYNHMGESLEQMFSLFNVKPQDQQYQLDVFEKVIDTFHFKLELKNFPNREAVVDNFRRQGHVPGGGCVKFFRKLL